MQNIFSGNSQKEVPKTLNDCIKPDAVSSNLWIWADRIKKVGNILLRIILIFGTIITIRNGICAYQEYPLADEDTLTLITVLTVIINLFICCIIALIEYFLYHIIALLIETQASKVQNINISTNLALYSVVPKPGDKFTDPQKINNTPKSVPPSIQVLNTPNISDDIEIVEEKYIETKCPYCGKVLVFPESTQKATCPWCNIEIEI